MSDDVSMYPTICGSIVDVELIEVIIMRTAIQLSILPIFPDV